MKKAISILIASLGIAISSIAFAEMPMEKNTGLALNTLVPEISAIDIVGNKQTIRQLSGENGLLLIFFRSADWCPYCKKHLIEIDGWTQRVNGLGYKIAAISYDSIETLKGFSEKRQLKYPLLADQNHKTMESFNVINQENPPGTEHYGIPYPGVMVIDTNGKLIYKYFYEGYKKRVTFEIINQALLNK